MAQPETNRSRADRRAGARRGTAPDEGLGPRELIELGPALARLGLFASLRAAGWATASTAAIWKRIACAARDRESAVGGPWAGPPRTRGWVWWSSTGGGLRSRG